MQRYESLLQIDRGKLKEKRMWTAPEAMHDRSRESDGINYEQERGD